LALLSGNINLPVFEDDSWYPNGGIELQLIDISISWAKTETTMRSDQIEVIDSSRQFKVNGNRKWTGDEQNGIQKNKILRRRCQLFTVKFSKDLFVRLLIGRI